MHSECRSTFHNEVKPSESFAGVPAFHSLLRRDVVPMAIRSRQRCAKNQRVTAVGTLREKMRYGCGQSCAPRLSPFSVSIGMATKPKDSQTARVEEAHRLCRSAIADCDALLRRTERMLHYSGWVTPGYTGIDLPPKHDCSPVTLPERMLH
jgi:hypothetical protein